MGCCTVVLGSTPDTKPHEQPSYIHIVTGSAQQTSILASLPENTSASVCEMCAPRPHRNRGKLPPCPDSQPLRKGMANEKCHCCCQIDGLALSTCGVMNTGCIKLESAYSRKMTRLEYTCVCCLQHASFSRCRYAQGLCHSILRKKEVKT